MTDPKTEQWRARAAEELKNRPLESLTTETLEGLTLAPVYGAPVYGAPVYGADEWPGLPPFTRGVYATMYAGRPWTIRQYGGFSTVAETNAFYRANLAAGQTGLSVAFDLPTHRGYDSDDPLAAADVGMAGVAIDSVEDMKRLFEGIPLADTSTSLTMNGAVLPILAAWLVAAEEQGAKAESLAGTIQNDILKEFQVRNTYIYPLAPSLRITTDIIDYAARHLPRFNPVSISGYHLQEAGADAVTELGVTLANGLEYVREAHARGLKVESFAPRLSFFFGVGMNFFMEAAKLRAARRLWATRLHKEFAPADPRALQCRIHCQTSGVSLAEADPLNNIIRTAYEALAAVLGGTQSLHTNSYDEALALPSDEAARLARNTQLILAEEMNLTAVADPLGGSHYVEHLTDQLTTAAGDLLAEIEQQGGIVPATESGWIKTRVEAVAARRQARQDSGRDAVIGVNRYPRPEAPTVPVRRVSNEAVRREQIARLTELRARRDAQAVEAALAALATAAGNGGNLLEATLPAMRARATVGEVSATLARVFGRHQPPVRLTPGVYGRLRAADPDFAATRAAVAAYAEKSGPPRLALLKLGQDGHDRGALAVAAALTDLGFAVTSGPLFDTPEQAAARTLEAGAHLAGISTLAGAHLTLVPAFLRALHAKGGQHVRVVVGGVVPPEDYAALFAAGVSAIYGPGTNITRAAAELLGLLAGRNEPPHSRTTVGKDSDTSP